MRADCSDICCLSFGFLCSSSESNLRSVGRRFSHNARHRSGPADKLPRLEIQPPSSPASAAAVFQSEYESLVCPGLYFQLC